MLLNNKHLGKINLSKEVNYMMTLISLSDSVRWAKDRGRWYNHHVQNSSHSTQSTGGNVALAHKAPRSLPQTCYKVSFISPLHLASQGCKSTGGLQIIWATRKLKGMVDLPYCLGWKTPRQGSHTFQAIKTRNVYSPTCRSGKLSLFHR